MNLEDIVKKIDNNEELTEEEIKTLLWEANEIYEEEGEDHRWQRDMFTVVEVNGRCFGISWMKGLTECQENDYWEQPYEVGCETELKTVTNQVWKPIAEVKKEDNQLIIVKQLPLIEEHLKELSIEIDKKVEDAKSLVCTEENVKIVKQIKADLNKEFKELEQQRKNVKEQIMRPYNEFDNIYKEHISEKYKSADAELKNKIDDIDNGLKEEKKQEIINYFNEYAQNFKIDFIKFEDVNINITLNASKKSLQKQVQDFIDRINVDLATIALQNNNDEILVEYKTNGYKLNEAMQTVAKRLKAIEEEKKKQEEMVNKRLEGTKTEEIHTTVDNILQAPIREEKNNQDKKIVHIEMNENHEITKESYEELEDVFSKPLEQSKVEIKKDEEQFTVQFKVKHETKERIKKIKEFLDREGYDYE